MTKKQELGKYGEKLVRKICNCPKCKKSKTLRILSPNFKCVDLICDFCGYLAQVKTKNDVPNIMEIPNIIPGAEWKTQEERMNAGIYFPLFLVLKNDKKNAESIHYLSADLQNNEIFKRRKNPLSKDAKRAGWLGFDYDLQSVKDRFVCLYNNLE